MARLMARARAMLKPVRSLERARLQYGVIPYRRGKGRIEIMLITSRNTRRWIVPKGWPLARKPSREVARLEALEEAGLEGTIGKRAVGSFHYHKRLKDGSVVLCRVAVFAFEVGRELENWLESNERQRRWFDAQRAIKLVREPELKALIGAFVRRLESGELPAFALDARNAGRS
jgi:8-oxo-dGTP pyrophosphatase MutT (NUDIX family)